MLNSWCSDGNRIYFLQFLITLDSPSCIPRGLNFWWKQKIDSICVIMVHLKKDRIKMEKGMALASEDVNVVLKKNKWIRNTPTWIKKRKMI